MLLRLIKFLCRLHRHLGGRRRPALLVELTPQGLDAIYALQESLEAESVQDTLSMAIAATQVVVEYVDADYTVLAHAPDGSHCVVLAGNEIADAAHTRLYGRGADRDWN